MAEHEVNIAAGPDRAGASTRPEDLFVELFTQTFGVQKVQLLCPQHPVRDIYGGSRYVDFALRAGDQRVAFEIDGLQWHHPAALSIEDLEDQILRQNSLVHEGWRVFRWTDREVAEEPEKVKEELALFLESVPGLLAFEEFLPRRTGGLIELREHQQEALDALQRLRDEGKTIALLTHAAGAGKTRVAIADAKRMGGRTLYITHRKGLVDQAAEEFRQLWPEASTGVLVGGRRDPDAQNVIGSVQSVSRGLERFDPDAFTSVVIDEAHHATAPSYQKILGHFTPRFILGLTGTPERADGQSVLDLFEQSAHRLTLEEAVRAGQLVPIRCVRVETNVDLSRVRFNQVQYNRRDIEETIAVPGRDRLIVQTYLDHVPNRKAVVFCVNVRHGEQLAERIREAGVAAQSVSGRMTDDERKEVLDAFAAGNVRVLCACDILNEGWDCPDVEVLMMARPTLSKVLYMQQLGRGTRKAPGKESLLVFDFVDNATRYNAPVTLHRITGKSRYRRGGLVMAPDHVMEREEEMAEQGQTPPAIVEIGIWATDYQEVDLFDWQTKLGDVLTVSDLEVKLATSEGRVRRAIDRGQVAPDHSVPVGDRTYHYFEPGREEEIREKLGLPRVDDSSIRQLFLDFVSEMDMAASYKPVLLLSVLDCVDPRGVAEIASVVSRFRKFYEDRRRAGRSVEKGNTRMARVEQLEDLEVQRVMLGMPFEKFERRHYLRYDRDLSRIRFAPKLWRQLRRDDIDAIRRSCEQALDQYYRRLEGAS